MPEEENKKPSQRSVDIDTSGPGAEVDVAEEKVKEEGVVETEAPTTEQESEIKVEETKEEETVKEIKKDDEQLEEYSKGVQSRTAFEAPLGEQRADFGFEESKLLARWAI